MSREITFFVSGEPRQQGSKSARVVRGKPILTDGFGSTPKRLKSWRKSIRDTASAKRLDEFPKTPAPIFAKHEPVSIYLAFYFLKPKSVKRDYPSVMPDLDKLVRAALDGLTGELFHDDAQVIDIVTTKRYVSENQPLPGLKVYVKLYEKGTGP